MTTSLQSKSGGTLLRKTKVQGFIKSSFRQSVLGLRYSPMDIFIDDSDQCAEFQRFEYSTVKPFHSPSGLPLRDDAYPDLLQSSPNNGQCLRYLVEGI